jgi:hypothetical protein
MLSHEDAVRIARSGEGAIVSELKRLSDELDLAKKDLEYIRQEREKLLDELERITG